MDVADTMNTPKLSEAQGLLTLLTLTLFNHAYCKILIIYLILMSFCVIILFNYHHHFMLFYLTLAYKVLYNLTFNKTKSPIDINKDGRHQS